MSTRLSHRIVSVIMSLALVISTTPCPALARTESDAVPRWSDEIPELLSAGEYVEGEALVGIIGTSDETALSTQEGLPGDDIEAIMTVEGEDVLAGSVTDESGTITTQSELDNVTLSVVTSSSMSTEELLYALAQDDRVAFAEPNYLTTLTEDEALEGDDTDPAGIEPDENAVAEATDEALADEGAADVVASDPTAPTDEQEFVIGSNSADDTLLPQAEVSVADLTPLQWSNSNATTVRTSAMNNQSPSHSANIPSFGATGSNMDREVRVAVFDGSVDHTNPDLSNVVYHFSADEMQALGCGEWAYNATNAGGQDSSAFAPTNHATHCAGIIGAEWDGKGISGAASKARIVSVQVMDAVPGKGWIKYESLLRGYAFVDAFNKHCATDADKIRVCSLSIGTFQTSRAIDAAVRAVGADHGTVSVFSAGNQSTDNDTIVRTSSTLRQNPYALVVASIDTAGNLSSFSSWGAQTVTLASPGTGILSTVNTGSAAYFPDAALGTDGTILYEGFEGSTYNFSISQINYDVSQRVSPDCDLTSGNQPRFAGDHATLVPVDPNLCNQTDGGNIAYFLLTLDVTDCMSRLTSSPNIQFGIAFSGKGDSVKMDCVQDSEGTKLPIKRNDDGSTGGWSDTAVDLSGATVSGGKLTLILSIIVDKDTQYLAMDSIGIGTSDVPYALMDGTSMATPLVAGCTAVYAAKHPGDNGAQLAARVRASVTKTSQMANITSTGGILDLANDVEGTVEEVSPVTPAFPLYEDTLPLTTSTGENPFVMDTIGDLETYGKLAELNGALYYFPAWGTVTTTSSSVAFPYHNMFVFDLASGTWDANRTGRLPQVVLANMSVCTYDGKLWVVGGEGEVNDNLPYVNPAGAAHVYSFDPASNQWTEHNATGMSLWADLTIFADKDGLKILDAGESDKSSSHARNASIRSYDPTTGMGNAITSFNQAIKIPLVAVHNDTTYIIDNSELADSPSDGEALKLSLWSVKGATIETGSVKIPPVLIGNRSAAGIDAVSYADQNTQTNASLLAGDHALYLVGHTDTKKTADTWVLDYLNMTEFKPYEKHLAATRPMQTTAAFYAGKIYGLASAWGEQDGRIFRTTAVEEYLHTNKDTYDFNEPIMVDAQCHNAGAWVGMYKKGENPGSDTAPIFRYNVADEGNPTNILATRDESGRRGDYAPGEFTIMLFGDGNYDKILATKGITVKRTYNDPTWAHNANCTEFTATFTATDDPTKAITRTVTGDGITSVTTKPATCDEKGQASYTARLDMSGVEGFKHKDGKTAFEDTRIVAIDPLGHDWGDWTYLEAERRHTRACRRDGSHAETADCTFGEPRVVEEATASRDGLVEYECTVCGGTYREAVPAVRKVLRVSGSDRYDTALAAADELKGRLGVERFDSVVVACGTNFADALSGSYLANRKGAPIVLVNTAWPDNVRAAKDYIAANLSEGGTVYVLGGDSAVAASFDEGLNVRRLAGEDRYETNLKILEEAGVDGEDVLVVTGTSFADSLSASAAGRPILMVGGSLTGAQREFVAKNGGSKFYVIGGPLAVSDAVKGSVDAAASSPSERIQGSDRQETSVLVARTFFDRPTSAVVAYALDYPDGLCGGTLASALGAPLILTNIDNYDAAEGYLSDNGIRNGYVLGGQGQSTRTLINDSLAKLLFGTVPVPVGK